MKTLIIPTAMSFFSILAFAGTPAKTYDPAMSACQRGCALKENFDESKSRKQPGVAFGDITRCPVSGVIFKVTEDSSFVIHNGEKIYTCCEGCAERFKAEPKKFAKNLN